MKFILTIPVMFIALPLLADGGASVVYEGALRSGDGRAFPAASYGATVSLHATASDADPLWWRHYDLTLDECGLFRIELSDTPTRPAAERAPTNTLAAVLRLLSSTTIYVGLRLDANQAETVQRQRLLAHPYALSADDALGSIGSFSAGTATFGGFVTTKSAKQISFNAGVDVGAYMTFTSDGRSAGTALTATDSLTVGRNADIRTKQSVSGHIKLVNGTFSVSGDLTATKEPVCVGSLDLPKRENRSNNPIVLVNGVNGCVPFGTIILWYGNTAELPEDWKVCDGTTYTNSYAKTVETPNLVDRFPVGANASAVLAGGRASDGGAQYALNDHQGEREHTLLPEELPPHIHKSTTKWYGRAANESFRFNEHTTLMNGSRVDNFRHKVDSWQTSATGGGKAHENLPQHKRLVYIMKVE